tara:strand:+ start:39 stop:341 length:303 start_codon:yes stop_codon:yes gene_type:complete
VANIFFAGKKASQEKAKISIEKAVKGTKYKCYAKFESDDGGSHIALYVEVGDPNDFTEHLNEDFKSIFVPHSKWLGWRYIIMKVPYGHINTFIKKEVEHY